MLRETAVWDEALVARRCYAIASIFAPPDDRRSDGVARVSLSVDFLRMAADDTDFRIRLGRSRSRGTPVDRRARSFVAQVNVAVRKAGTPTASADRQARAAGASTQEDAARRSLAACRGNVTDGAGMQAALAFDLAGSSSRRGSSNSTRSGERAGRRCREWQPGPWMPTCDTSSVMG
jgi:hypothetical protein